MNIIGITGASGSGKTYFSKQLGKSLEDSSIINLDYTFFEILNTDSEIREQIINLYGEKAYDRSGYINISELQNMKEFKFENFFNIIKDKLDNKILQIINENESKNIQNLVIEWFLLPKTIAFQMSDYSILISPSEKDREKSLLKRDENETTEKIKKRTEAIPIDYNDYNYDKISINTYQKGCYDKDIEEIVKKQKNVRRKEPVTNFGNVDIEFDTNKIFLLFQILYRIESLEDKINSNNSEISYLSNSIKEFKEIIEKK